MRAAQERRGRAVVVGRGAAPVGLRVFEIADHVDLVVERLERLQDLRELEAGALGRRRPLGHDRAVREVDAAEPGSRPAAAVWASAVAAGTIDSRNGNASVTPAPCRNVRRDRCFLVHDSCHTVTPSGLMTVRVEPRALRPSSFSSETGRFRRCRATATRTGCRSRPARRTIARTVGMSALVHRPAERISQQLLGDRRHRTHRIGSSSACRRSAGPLSGVPSASCP